MRNKEFLKESVFSILIAFVNILSGKLKNFLLFKLKNKRNLTRIFRLIILYFINNTQELII